MVETKMYYNDIEGVEIRYYFDNSTVWCRCSDIYDIIGYSRKIARDVFENKIPESHKTVIIIEEKDNYGFPRKHNVGFITAYMAREIAKDYISNGYKVLDAIDNIELECGMTEYEDTQNHLLRHDLRELGKAIKEKNDTKVYKYAANILDSKTIKDISKTPEYYGPGYEVNEDRESTISKIINAYDNDTLYNYTIEEDFEYELDYGYKKTVKGKVEYTRNKDKDEDDRPAWLRTLIDYVEEE